MPDLRLALEIDGIEIPAVITTPEAPPRAALLLIPGSLNSDVDGNFAPMFPGQPEMRTWVYKNLAEQLAARGMAVLRYSKSGPGTNTVQRDPERVKAKYSTFLQRPVVASAFLDELLRRASGLPLAIAGHSEGSVVATLLAQRRPEVQRLVLLSGPSKPLLQLMIWQRWLAGEGTEAQHAEAQAWARDYAAGRPLPPDMSANPLASMFAFWTQPGNRPYLHSLECVDPCAEIARVSQPVLLVQGGRDLSVRAENADLLQRAQPRAEIARFPGLQHFYKSAPEGLAPQDSMSLSTESDPAVASAIADWLG